VALALLYWVVETALHTWVLHQGSYAGNLLPDNANEAWMRLTIVALILLLGHTSRRMVEHADALAASNRSILDNSSDAYVAVDRLWQITHFNSESERLFDASRNAALGNNFWDLFPETASSFYRPLQETMRGRGRKVFEGFYAPANRWLEVHASPLNGGMAFYLRDITSQREYEASLRENRNRLQAILDSAGDGIITINRLGMVETFNAAAETIFGYAAEEVLGRNVAMLMTGADAEQHDDYINAYLYHGVSRIINIGPREVVARRKDGATFPMDLAISQMRLGEEVHFIGIVRDLSERKQAERALEYMSNFDPLTELPNRSLMRDRLTHAIHQAHRDDSRVAVLFLDLDRFKNINDTFGYTFGDTLLRTVAERLRACIREGDTVARLGGDEFVILLEGIHTDDNAGTVAGKILASLGQPMHIDEHEVVLTVSIGIALYPADDLLRNADTAMYRAKELGRNTYQYFTADMTRRAVSRMHLEQDLRRALEREEFELFYQPQIEVAGERVIGVEALLRWRHPERGLVSPGDFIPVLEETGLILPVGDWVVRRACEQAREWQLAGLTPLRVAVNLSALQFRESELCERVARHLEATGLDPRYLELEITEGLLVENIDATIRTLTQLHDMGLHLSIDDFGTGYSSLNYLKRFPLHTLKIDQSFVRDVTTDNDSAAIARAIIGLAESLRLKVIAEGVETAEQLEFMRREGCDEIQGFYFCRPLPTDELETWLQQREKNANTLQNTR